LPTPIIVPSLDPEQRASLLERFNQTRDPETRLRYQMVLLSSGKGLTTGQIASITFRCHDVVLRVLRRFLSGGPDAVPRGHSPGRPLAVSPEWQSELRRVIDLDPHEVGVPSANWTTGLLAGYLKGKTEVAVDQETVREHLHRLGYAYKRPNWTVQHKAQERESYLGNASGWRSS
jgi:transposase